MYQQLFVFLLTAVCFQSVEELKGRVCGSGAEQGVYQIPDTACTHAG